MGKQKHNQELIQEMRENNRKAAKDKHIKFKIIGNHLFKESKELIYSIMTLNLKIFSLKLQRNKRN